MQTITPDLADILKDRFQAAADGFRSRFVTIADVSGAVACDTSAMTAAQGTESDSGLDPSLSYPYTYSPDNPPAVPAVTIGAYWSRNHTGAYGGGPIANSIGGDFTQIDSTRTTFSGGFSSFGVAAYQAIPLGGGGGDMTVLATGFSGSAFHSRAIAVSFPTEATAPIHSGSQVGTGGTAVLDGVPTAGNLLVAVLFVEGRGVGEGASAGWTLIAEEEIYSGTGAVMVCQIIMRCVDAGEDENITVGGGAFSHWSFVTEWPLIQTTLLETFHTPKRVAIDKSLRMSADQAEVDFTNEDLELGWGPGNIIKTNQRIAIDQWYGDESNAVRTFTGLVDRTRDHRDILTTTLSCRDMMAVLIDQTFSATAPQGADEDGAVRTEANGVYQNREVSYIVNDFLDRAGWPAADREITPTSYVLDEFIVSDGASWAEAMIGDERLTGLVGYSAWADENGIFHFAPTLISQNLTDPEVPVYTFRSGEDIVSLDDEIDQYDLRTRIKVRGPLTTTTLQDTWRELWRTSKLRLPVGIYYRPTDPTSIRVVDRGTRRLYRIRQSDQAILSSVYLGSAIPHPLGLSGDPSDSTIYWVLNAPWIDGVSGGNSVKKVRFSDNHVLASYSIPSGRWSAIKVSAAFIWLTNLDTDRFYKRSKADASAISNYQHTYSAVVQANPSGIMVDGTTLYLFWSNGGTTARFLVCDESAPTTITKVVLTAGTVLHGGEMDTTTHTECYGDSDSLGLVAKFTLIEAVDLTKEVFAEVVDSDLEDELGELALLEPRQHDTHPGDPTHPFETRRKTLNLSVITSLAQATETAQRQLDIDSQRRRVLDAGIVGNPALQKTDYVAVFDPPTGISTGFAIDTYRTDMQADGTYLGTVALIPVDDVTDVPDDDGDATQEALLVGGLDSFPALYEPTLLIANLSMTIPFLDAAPAVYAPTATQGAAALALTLLDSGPTLYAPTVFRSAASMIQHKANAQGSSVGTSFSVTLDSTPGAGNTLMGLFTSGRGIGQDIVVPSGWTEDYHYDNGNDQCVKVAHRTVSGDGATVTFTLSQNMGWADIVVVEANGSIQTSGFLGDHSGTSHAVPSITPTNGSNVVLVIVAQWKDPYGISSGPSGYTNIESASAGGDARALAWYRTVTGASGGYDGTYVSTNGTTADAGHFAIE